MPVLTNLLAFAMMAFMLASTVSADATSIRCNRDPHVHCLYTPPSAGLFKGVAPQVELTKGQLVSQQTEQGGGKTYIFPDNSAASVTLDCASGGTNEFDLVWAYGQSVLSHLRNSTGKGLIGFSDAKPEAKPGQRIFSSVPGIDATIRCPAF